MRTTGKRWLLLLTGIISLSLAGCGGFQLRSKPTAAPTPAGSAVSTATPSVSSPTVAPTSEPTTTAPTPLPTETSVPEPTLAVGGSARVVATGGVNVRDSAAASATLLSKLNPGDVVSLVEGPAEADSYTWWKIDNGSGIVGWVAIGTVDDPWLEPNSESTAPSGGQLLDRSVQLGDQVQVTTQDGKYLNIRKEAGSGAELLAKVPQGTLFTVRSGPVRQDDLLWWELEGDNEIKGWAAEGEGTDRWLTPVQR